MIRRRRRRVEEKARYHNIKLFFSYALCLTKKKRAMYAFLINCRIPASKCYNQPLLRKALKQVLFVGLVSEISSARNNRYVPQSDTIFSFTFLSLSFIIFFQMNEEVEN